MAGRLRRFFRKNAVNFMILAVVLSLYAATMTPQIRAVFYESKDKPVYQGADVPYCAIQCNVYQGAEYIPAMLEILRERNTRITWNMGGVFVDANASLTRRIAESGQELGNHGYRHLQHSTLSYEENCEEIRKCHEAVVRAAGVGMSIFAPPSGDYNDTTIRAARDLGYTPVMWSADTIDWRDQDVELILSRVRDKMDRGGILLIHPTAATLKALPQILDILEEKGLSVVPIGELLQKSADAREIR